VTEAERCPNCGAELAGASPEGLCPRCLLKAGLVDSRASELSAADTTPTPPGGTGDAVDIARLARLFPQLDIQKLLGRGGMGTVYLARQKALDRQIALKLLAPKPGLDAEFAERFGREARALARLNHPGIVGIYDFGQVEDLYYFLMEYVDGVSLREAMRQDRLETGHALALVPQICDALQYAHDEGVIHRDIKPENILIDKKGRIKIADFGLAKLLGTTEENEQLTGSHHVMGTRNYMAPEQLEHPKRVDHRADIYSLGVVFYEMLTGELPLGRFSPPSRKVQVDVRLDEVVLRALEKEPERRYQHASEIKTDIGGIPSREQQGAHDQPQAFFLLEGKGQRSHGQLVGQLAVLGGLMLWAGFRKSDPWAVYVLCWLSDGFLFQWFGYSYSKPGKLSQGWPYPNPLTEGWPTYLIYLVIAMWAIVALRGSSGLQGALIAGFMLAAIFVAGVRVVVPGEALRRILALLSFQTVLLMISAFPAVRPLDYFSWIYRLSGSKPSPDDALLIRGLCIAILAVVLGWKIRTHRAARRLAIPAPVGVVLATDKSAVNPVLFWFLVSVVVLLFVLLLALGYRVIG
jgi:tRNA A-37 threonylcarbamoyl transferase component Bud32